jgi:hypothetical protein
MDPWISQKSYSIDVGPSALHNQASRTRAVRSNQAETVNGWAWAKWKPAILKKDPANLVTAEKMQYTQP